MRRPCRGWTRSRSEYAARQQGQGCLGEDSDRLSDLFVQLAVTRVDRGSAVRCIAKRPFVPTRSPALDGPHVRLERSLVVLVRRAPGFDTSLACCAVGAG